MALAGNCRFFQPDIPLRKMIPRLLVQEPQRYVRTSIILPGPCRLAVFPLPASRLCLTGCVPVPAHLRPAAFSALSCFVGGFNGLPPDAFLMLPANAAMFLCPAPAVSPVPCTPFHHAPYSPMDSARVFSGRYPRISLAWLISMVWAYPRVQTV